MKPMEIKEKYGIPCFSKVQDEFIDRYQRGVRSEYLMKRIKGYNYIDSNGIEHTSAFKLSNRARDLLLSNKLHRVSNKCCKILKKDVARSFEKSSGLKPILAIRESEGINRKSKYKTCFTKDGKFTPIHDLTDELLDKIYQKYGIEIPDVYNYITRTGCMGCPYGSWKHYTEKELKLINKNQLKFVFEYFKESYEVLGIERGDYIDTD